MDQIQIGKFIAACRKEQNLTQAQLAEQLGISDRAVSKWETGRSLPDAALMMPLCAILKMDLNELFCGRRITMEDFKKIAEQNLLEMKKREEQYNKPSQAQKSSTRMWLSERTEPITPRN